MVLRNKFYYLLVFLLFFYLDLAQAQIEKGVWKGEISENANCFFEIQEIYYENSIITPLNLRMKTQVGSVTYVLSHPFVIDPQKNDILVDENKYVSLVSLDESTFALSIQTFRQNEFDIPQNLFIMEKNIKYPENSESLTCSNFTKVY